MTTPPPPPAAIQTLADLLERLGGIPLARVRYHPSPGTATEQDVLIPGQHPCELVDGVLVEKAPGYRESCLAGALLALVRAFVLPRNFGLVSGADGTVGLFPGLVRIPDVAFTSWDRLPNRRMPAEPIPHLAPDLAVEVLSHSNTEAEMARKRGEYFTAGARLVWIVDPDSRSVTVYTSPTQSNTLAKTDLLDGGAVLPGFTLSLRDLFAELDRAG